jgi:ubiquinone/menaquinone biosynthesis C-methylase UbiE
MIDRLIARQLARPSGVIGRWLTARWLNRANGAMNRLALDGLRLGADDRVLEIGFGGGDLLARMLQAQPGATLAGVDISADMVAVVSRRLSAAMRAGRLRLTRGDIQALPYRDGAFSRVCSVNTIYFWGDPEAALRECARVLSPGGLLVLCFDAREVLERWPGHRYGFTLYDAAEVVRMLERAGFGEVFAVEAEIPRQGRVHRVSAVRP